MLLRLFHPIRTRHYSPSQLLAEVTVRVSVVVDTASKGSHAHERICTLSCLGKYFHKEVLERQLARPSSSRIFPSLWSATNRVLYRFYVGAVRGDS